MDTDGRIITTNEELAPKAYTISGLILAQYTYHVTDQKFDRPKGRSSFTAQIGGHVRGHGHRDFSDRGHGRGHGHDFFKKSRTRT